jgi:hypothetical protein
MQFLEMTTQVKVASQETRSRTSHLSLHFRQHIPQLARHPPQRRKALGSITRRDVLVVFDRAAQVPEGILALKI